MRSKLAMSLLMAASAVAVEAAAQEEASPAAVEGAGPALESAGSETGAVPAEVPPTVATIPVDVAAPADPAAVPEAAASRNRLVEEIIVTAQKREENAQDVPISITAFSGDALDAKGIGDPKSLAQSIPGVTYGETVNFSIIYVRGVGTDAFLPDSDLSVAMYMDGIYFPFANGLSQSLGAIERVEVLKGPQGTLFGRNSTGGAFNITTRSPSLTTPELQFSTGYSKFDTNNNRVYVNVPLADTFAINGSFTYNMGDNYYDGTIGSTDPATGDPFPREIEKGGRLRALWQPADWMDLTLTALRHEKRGLATSALPNIRASTATQALYRLSHSGASYTAPKEYVVNVDVPSFFKLDNYVQYAQLGLHPGWFDIKLLGSYQKVTTDNDYDFDGTTAPFITFDARGQFAKVKTAEIQFISNKESGPEWLEWVAGVYYIDQYAGFPRNRLTAGGLDIVDDQNLLGILDLPPEAVAFYQQLAGAGGLPDGGSLALVSLQKTKALAEFGQATAHITESMYLTLGGRFQDEKRRVVESSINTANADGNGVTELLQFDRPKKSDTNFSPKAVLGYNWLEDSLVYLSWSKGFKSGTFNTVNVYDQPEYVQPESVTSYELGSKNIFADGQITLNAAAFHTEVKNQQVQFVSLLAGGAVRLENAGKVSIDGGELELAYKPEWDENLFLAGSVTYLDSKYDEYENASAYDDDTIDPTTGDPTYTYNFGTGDFSGNRTVRTPKWSANAVVNRAFQVSGGDIEAGLTGFYSSDLFFQAQNNPISKQKAYQTLDGQISYLHSESNFRITLLGKNLTDERYQLTQFHTDAGVQHVLAPPRSFGVRLDITFN